MGTVEVPSPNLCPPKKSNRPRKTRSSCANPSLTDRATQTA